MVELQKCLIIIVFTFTFYGFVLFGFDNGVRALYGWFRHGLGMVRDGLGMLWNLFGVVWGCAAICVAVAAVCVAADVA